MTGGDWIETERNSIHRTTTVFAAGCPLVHDCISSRQRASNALIYNQPLLPGVGGYPPPASRIGRVGRGATRPRAGVVSTTSPACLVSSFRVVSPVRRPFVQSSSRLHPCNTLFKAASVPF